jgi:hypothetical protein
MSDRQQQTSIDENGNCFKNFFNCKQTVDNTLNTGDFHFATFS